MTSTSTPDSPLVDTEALRQAFNAGGAILKVWGDRVRSRRRILNVSPDVLASFCDSTPQTIGRIEKGMLNPRDHLRSAIARALACEVNDLFSYPTFDELSNAYFYDQAAS